MAYAEELVLAAIVMALAPRLATVVLTMICSVP